MDLKSTFENLKDRATEMAQAGVAQSKRLAEIAKLKKAYIEIGKLYYAEQGASPDGAFVAACERITASKAAIETNNERIAELKQPGDPEAEIEAAAETAEEAAEAVADVVEAVAEEDKQD